MVVLQGKSCVPKHNIQMVKITPSLNLTENEPLFQSRNFLWTRVSQAVGLFDELETLSEFTFDVGIQFPSKSQTKQTT